MYGCVLLLMCVRMLVEVFMGVCCSCVYGCVLLLTSVRGCMLMSVVDGVRGACCIFCGWISVDVCMDACVADDVCMVCVGACCCWCVWMPVGVCGCLLVLKRVWVLVGLCLDACCC